MRKSVLKRVILLICTLTILSLFLLCSLNFKCSESKMPVPDYYSYNKDWFDIIKQPVKLNWASSKFTIAILDTGVDFSNPMLKESKYMDLSVSDNIESNRVHGTAVAGVLAANGSTFKGIVPGIKLISIKLGNNEGWSIDDLCKGLEIAISLKPCVINISCGVSKCSERLENLVQKAFENNIVIVAASGNEGKDGCDYPARYESVLSVGAIDRNFEITEISNYGSKVKVFAPGEDIMTAAPSNTTSKNTIQFFGTSIAAPFVTGLVVCIKDKDPDIKVKEIMEKIINSSYKVNSNGNTINIINYYKALQ